MINFLAKIGEESEYIIFKWIWEKKEINFSLVELNECFINILKSYNIMFIEWFYSLNIIDLNDDYIKNKIVNEILENANNYKDYIISIYICSLHKKNLIMC